MPQTGRQRDQEVSIAIACEAPQNGGLSSALVTALSCLAAGFSDVTLYGVQPPTTAQSIELSPNASRILRTLKALEPLRSNCFEPQFVHQRSFRTGFQLSIQALGAMAEGRYNAPFLHIEEQDLCRVLTQLASERGAVLVDAHIDQLSQSDTAVSVSVGAQSQAQEQKQEQARQHDVVIVTSDPDQRLRAMANAETLTKQETPYVHWRSRLAATALPPGAFGHVVNQWLGPHHHLSYHFGKDAEQLHLSVITYDLALCNGDGNGDGETANNRVLIDALTQWHPSLRALLEACAPLKGELVTTNASPSRLAHGRIVFLGTSCHSLLPHLPQQSALGIEDAWVAARMLEQWEDEPAGGWVEYEKYRLPRARRLTNEAERRAAYLCTPSATEAWRRNLALTFGSRFLPELAMEKNDWLYGYDAVNGFE